MVPFNLKTCYLWSLNTEICIQRNSSSLVPVQLDIYFYILCKNLLSSTPPNILPQNITIIFTYFPSDVVRFTSDLDPEKIS